MPKTATMEEKALAVPESTPAPKKAGKKPATPEQDPSPKKLPEHLDVDRVVREGVVTMRELTFYTSDVMKALEERKKPILISRYNKIVAVIAGFDMRHLVDTIVANNPELRDSMSMANKALEAGQTIPASEAFGD